MNSRKKRLLEMSLLSEALFDWQRVCEQRYGTARKAEQIRNHRSEFNAFSNESLLTEYRNSEPHAIGWTTSTSQRPTTSWKRKG